MEESGGRTGRAGEVARCGEELELDRDWGRSGSSGAWEVLPESPDAEDS
jgi:hypothetical protein